MVGAGVVGLSVMYELGRSGFEADCFDAGIPMGARSCGDCRIFRLAHDRPQMVALAHQAHRGWQDWSHAAGVRLVGDQGTVISGDITTIAAAMGDAGAPFTVTDVAPTLPAAGPAGPFLHDVLGGVIQAAATGRFLLQQVGARVIHRAVTGVQVEGGTATVTLDDDRRTSYDSVLVVAGAATAGLMAPLRVELPARLEHHVRLTFRLRDAAATPPCWIDQSQSWRPDFTSYGQAPVAGRWAVGGHLPAVDTAWSLTRDQAADRARDWLTSYLREYVTGCETEILDTIHCDTPGLGDGVHSARVGPVLAVWGDNLFKFAPILGHQLASAATTFGSWSSR